MKRIELTRGKFAIVDDEDYERMSAFKWFCTARGYASRRGPRNGGNGFNIWMAREILGAGAHELVDHINGNKLDNRKCNLRICSKVENCRNRQILNKNNKSGFKGVKFDRRKNLWRADIGVDWGKAYLGRYKDIEAAAMIYDMAAIHYHGEFASLNFREAV